MLISVTNRHLCNNNFLNQIEQICISKPYAIILREKDLSIDKYIELASKVMNLCSKYNVKFYINHFIEAAINLNVKNVQVSFNQLISHPDICIDFNVFVSVHTLEEAIIADSMKVNGIIAGHIFKTDCKKDLEPKGVEFIHLISQRISTPLLAIGGINIQNAQEVICYGASGFCVMSELMKSDSVNNLISNYKQISE